MSEISYHVYPSGGDALRTMFGWINGAPGVSVVDGARVGLGNLGNAFTESDAHLQRLASGLGAEWEGRAADAVGTSLHETARFGGTGGAGTGVGSGTVDAYGQSFEALRPAVMWQDPGTWDWWEVPIDAVDIAIDQTPLSDVVSVQSDYFAAIEENRTLETQARNALVAHESAARDAVAAFAQPEASTTVGPAGIGPAGAGDAGFGGVAGAGGGAGPGGGLGAGGSVPGAAGAGGGLGSGGGSGGPSAAVPTPAGAGAASAGPGGVGSPVAPRAGLPGTPATAAPGSSGTGVPGVGAPSSARPGGAPGFGSPGSAAYPGASRGGAGTPAWKSPGTGGRTPGSGSGDWGSGGRGTGGPGGAADGRAATSGGRPGSPGPAGGAPAQSGVSSRGAAGGPGHVPMMGGGGGGGSGSTEHRRKYWIPTDELFDVPLPPHTDPVIGGEPDR